MSEPPPSPLSARAPQGLAPRALALCSVCIAVCAVSCASVDECAVFVLACVVPLFSARSGSDEQAHRSARVDAEAAAAAQAGAVPHPAAPQRARARAQDLQ